VSAFRQEVLVTGNTTSCGCYRCQERITKHGGSRQRVTLQHMARNDPAVHRPNGQDCPRYGGTGVTVCSGVDGVRQVCGSDAWVSRMA
jgi:hypothetical protein